MAIPLRSAQNPAIDWRNLMPEGVPQGTDVQVPYRSPNVPESVPMTGNLSTGGITPMADNSGLYAIYNKKNPYSAEADRYGAMAGKDMGGRLGQLPGIVAAYQAAKAGKAAQAFEEERSKKADEIMAKKEAWDKVEGDRKEQTRQLGIFEKEIGPEVMQAYAQKYKETGDLDVSSAYAAELANKRNKEKGLSAMPNFTKITGWDEGVITMLWDDKEGKPVQGRIDKYGNLGKMNEKNQFVPADSKDMLLSAYENRQRTEATRTRANVGGGSGASRDPVLGAIMSEINSLNRLEADSFEGLSPEQQAQREALQDEANKRRNIKVTPPASEPAAPAPAPAPHGPSALHTAAGAVADQLRPSGGGLAGAVGRIVVGQPQTQPAPQAPQAQPTIKDTSGREIYRGQDGKWYYI